MRESQMKKIIALAVASAFVAPAFAADVTVSGDVEFFYVDSDTVQEFDSGDQDVVVAASEEMDNGVTVSVSLEMDGNEDGMASDAVLTLSSGPVAFEIGDAATAAINTFDEKSDVAEQGGTGGANDDSTKSGISVTHTAAVTLTPVEGLTLKGSLSSLKYKKAVTAAAATSTADQKLGIAGRESTDVTSFAVQYSAMGVTVAYGSAEKEGDDDNATSTGFSIAQGPFYVGYEIMKNYGFADGKDVTNAGVSYDYGMGKAFYETGDVDDGTDKTETVAYGVSYKMGSVNLYLLQNQVDDGTTEDDQTIAGVEYAF
jgi:hypothetical protein